MLNSEQINKTSIKHPAWLLLRQTSLKAPNPRVIHKSNMIPRGRTIPIGVSHQISVESSLLPGLCFQDGPHGCVQLFAGIEKLFVTCSPATPTAFPLSRAPVPAGDIHLSPMSKGWCFVSLFWNRKKWLWSCGGHGQQQLQYRNCEHSWTLFTCSFLSLIFSLWCFFYSDTDLLILEL